MSATTCPATLSGLHSPDVDRLGNGCRFCEAAPGAAETARVKAEADRIAGGKAFVGSEQLMMTL